MYGRLEDWVGMDADGSFAGRCGFGFSASRLGLISWSSPRRDWHLHSEHCSCCSRRHISVMSDPW